MTEVSAGPWALSGHKWRELDSTILGDAVARQDFAESTHPLHLAEPLVNCRTEMTHALVRGTELGMPANIIRLSVGVEDVADLIDDVEQALAPNTYSFSTVWVPSAIAVAAEAHNQGGVTSDE